VKVGEREGRVSPKAQKKKKKNNTKTQNHPKTTPPRKNMRVQKGYYFLYSIAKKNKGSMGGGEN